MKYSVISICKLLLHWMGSTLTRKLWLCSQIIFGNVTLVLSTTVFHTTSCIVPLPSYVFIFKKQRVWTSQILKKLFVPQLLAWIIRPDWQWWYCKKPAIFPTYLIFCWSEEMQCQPAPWPSESLRGHCGWSVRGLLSVFLLPAQNEEFEICWSSPHTS